MYHLRGALSSATTSTTLFSAALGLATAAAISSATCHRDTCSPHAWSHFALSAAEREGAAASRREPQAQSCSLAQQTAHALPDILDSRCLLCSASKMTVTTAHSCITLDTHSCICLRRGTSNCFGRVKHHLTVTATARPQYTMVERRASQSQSILAPSKGRLEQVLHL